MYATFPHDLNIHEVLQKVSFMNFRFTLCDVKTDLKNNHYSMLVHIVHTGRDNDERSSDNTHPLTFMKHIEFNHAFGEQELVQTMYRCVLEKLRHEASELFMYKGVAVFHEHSDQLNGVEFNMLGKMIDVDPSITFKRDPKAHIANVRDVYDKHKEKLDIMKANRARSRELKLQDWDIVGADAQIQVLAEVLSDLNRLTR